MFLSQLSKAGIGSCRKASPKNLKLSLQKAKSETRKVWG